MLEYIKDWRIWLICVAIVVIIENPITAWCFENQNEKNWAFYAEKVLQHNINYQIDKKLVSPSLWHDWDKDPYGKSDFKKSKPSVGFKGLCFKWQKLNAVQSRYNFSKHWDLRLDTKLNLKKLAPEHSIKTVIGTSSRFEFVAGAEVGSDWMITPVAGITLKW